MEKKEGTSSPKKGYSIPNITAIVTTVMAIIGGYFAYDASVSASKIQGMDTLNNTMVGLTKEIALQYPEIVSQTIAINRELLEMKAQNNLLSKQVDEMKNHTEVFTEQAVELKNHYLIFSKQVAELIKQNSILEKELDSRNDATAINRHPYFVIEDFKDGESTENNTMFNTGLVLKNIGTYAIAVSINARSKRGVSYSFFRDKKDGNRNNCDTNENFHINFSYRPFYTIPETPEDQLGPNQRIDFEVTYKGLNGKSYMQEIIMEHDYFYNIYPPSEVKFP